MEKTWCQLTEEEAELTEKAAACSNPYCFDCYGDTSGV